MTGNTGYSVNWKPGGDLVSREDLDSQPLSSEDMAAIQSYASLILKSIGDTSGSQSGYDAASVKRLSDDLTQTRRKLDSAGRTKIANLYGSFLGNALIAANPEADGKWVRTKSGDVAIRFDKAPSGMTMFAMPITRVFKHIDDGEVHSIYSHFQAMPGILAGRPKVDSPPAAESSKTPPTRASGTDDFVKLGHSADGAEILMTVPQGQCCNCGTREKLAPVASPMHHRRALDGREVHFSFKLPYCGPCADTAGRYPKSLGFKVFATFVAYAVFIFLVLMPLSDHPFIMRFSGLFLLIFTALVIGTFYWIRKPTAPRKTVYQPVTLTRLDGNLDRIRKIEFKFSNPEYAKEFSKLNRSLIAKGQLRAI